jgi:hypothetical protein
MKTIIKRENWKIIGITEHLELTPKYNDHKLFGKSTFIPLDFYPTARIGSNIDRVRYVDEFGDEKSRWEPIA